MNLSILAIAAMSYVNVPYKWGGFDASGLDCSALIIKSFHDTGHFIQNMNSQQIYYWTQTIEGAKSCKPTQDCLLFYGRDAESITHVALAINDKILIEAGGAGRDSLNLSKNELLKRNARVRIREINYRSDLVASVFIDLKKIKP